MTRNQELKVIELRAKGISYSKIAQEVGVAKQTAIDYCKAREEEIATLHATELEGLYESFRITKEERIKGTASILGKIRDELEGRPLADLPTDKLIDLYLKTTAALKEEIVEPRFQTSREQERGREDREFLARISGNQS